MEKLIRIFLGLLRLCEHILENKGGHWYCIKCGRKIDCIWPR